MISVFRWEAFDGREHQDLPAPAVLILLLHLSFLITHNQAQMHGMINVIISIANGTLLHCTVVRRRLIPSLWQQYSIVIFKV